MWWLAEQLVASQEEIFSMKLVVLWYQASDNFQSFLSHVKQILSDPIYSRACPVENLIRSGNVRKVIPLMNCQISFLYILVLSMFVINIITHLF
jgi:hypothetical protein